MMKRLLLPILALFILFSPAAQAQQTNGYSVSRVYHDRGFFRQDRGTMWVERGNNGGEFYFQETERNDQSVTLYDASRKVYINLDTRQWIIWYTRAGGNYRKLYDITSME